MGEMSGLAGFVLKLVSKELYSKNKDLVEVSSRLDNKKSFCLAF